MSEDIADSILLREFTKELHNKNASLFIGAGLSMGAGYVDWHGLLKQPMLDLGLDPSQETDLVTIAQYYINKNGGLRNPLTSIILTKFSETRDPTENHRLLAKLPIQSYWTTNYDKLIEASLVEAKKVPDVKYTIKQLATTRFDRDVTVFKMHGDIDHPADVVISKDDYERYSTLMQPFVSALRGDLIERTFLFLGFSFTDPNIDYILSRVRIQYDRDQRTHYAIQRRVSRNDVDAEKKTLKQQLFIADLKRFGIQTVLVDDFTGITMLLKELLRRYKRNSIFISGAAYEYGDYTEHDAQEFIHTLAFKLAGQKNRIITGFGLGVGSAVINGTLENLSSRNKTVSDEDLVMRPFPQFPTGGISLASQWTAYRQEMVGYAGVAIFLFGNKIQNGEVVQSNGIREEFDLCVKNEVFPIPVGATGYMAKELWTEVTSNLARFFPRVDTDKVAPLLSKLGNAGAPLAEHCDTICDLIAVLQA